ncbi:MAG: SRPBCC domain-containing protein [Deltaproteobacteria bacterium]|nr:SRPBCC domain-containing protein [Deltaproteobacteria bacterium]
MATETIRVSAVIPASPYRIYQAWLNGLEHGAMTGEKASCEPWPGGRHTAWGGYIWGINQDLDPSRRILQSWRSTDFPSGADDSTIEVLFEPAEGGTRVVIEHTNVPRGLGKRYEQGWRDFYLAPMRAYFATGAPRTRVAAEAARKTSQARAKRAKQRSQAERMAGGRKRNKPSKAEAAKKVAKKAAKPAAKKVAKKTTKKVAKKKIVKKAAKKTAKKATKKTAAKKAVKKAAAKKKAARKK